MQSKAIQVYTTHIEDYLPTYPVYIHIQASTHITCSPSTTHYTLLLPPTHPTLPPIKLQLTTYTI